MMKIGIQSRLLLGDIPKEGDFHRIKAAGFDCIDFNLDRFLPNYLIYGGEINHFFDRSVEELCNFFSEYYYMAVKAELEFSQVHAPYPLYIYGKEEDKDYLHMVAEKSVAICAALHAPYLIVHPFKLAYPLDREEEYKRNIEFFQSLIPLLKEYGVKICLENLYDGFNGRICEGVCADPYQASEYIDELNRIAEEEIFAFCFDIGHANILGKNMKDTILILGNRIKAVHIHDNDGLNDLHQLPFTFTKKLAGEVSTDWKGYLSGLKEIGYKGVLSFETFGALKCFPEDLHDSVLRMVADIGKYFAGRLGE
ncbi:sugar phosphate isomerase/epimerase family protein [Kineothrix sp. MB12-C1]|uniref:sugar phosphate isomerase/epimerase family protein n=1 Tax=Kineothrix sp. MB12-C1 TaxID=3070215 RepID=UPI0027D2EC15|nr:sugar phosphate isomerase/epimerase [Kineothrix sp. MB12-C1]WMC93875.1 sugar phosphate isomerase/epimerase [Kineothrix sp. MB12-C1]